MAVTSWHFPTNANELADGDDDWTNESEIVSDDGDYAICANVATGDISHTLYGYDFNFAIPAGSTINGVEVEIERSQSSFTTNIEYRTNGVWLIDAAAHDGNNNKDADNSDWAQDPTWETYTYGGPTDLWGAVLTAADVNANDFGFGIQVTKNGSSSLGGAWIDYVKMRIYYSEPEPEFRCQVVC